MMTSSGHVAALATRPPPAPAEREMGWTVACGWRDCDAPIMLFALLEGIPVDRGRLRRGVEERARSRAVEDEVEK